MTQLLPVAVKRNPFLPRSLETFPYGLSLADMLGHLQLPVYLVEQGFLEVELNGELVPVNRLCRIKPKPGAVLAVYATPKGGGGGGKNPLRTVATLALVAGAAYLSGGLTTSLASQFAVGAAGPSVTGFYIAAYAKPLIAGALVLAGTAALNSIIPLPKPQLSGLNPDDNRTSRTLSITGTRNRANPYGPIPKVYGRHRVYPLYAAQPFTETIGNDQYLNVLFCAGYGPLELSDFRIGEVPIGQFRDVEIDVREGWPDDSNIKLFRNSVETDSYSDLLSKAGGAVIRESAADADEVTLDLAFNGLVAFDDQGRRKKRSVDLKVEYRTAGSTAAWTRISNARREATASDVTLSQAPDGAKYTDYKTTYPVAGNLSVTLRCPDTHVTSNGTTRLQSYTYRILVRAEGRSDWLVAVDQTNAIKAGQEETFDLPLQENGKVHYVRIESKQYSYYTNTPFMATNGGGYRRVPNPVSWSYGALFDGDGINTFTDDNEQNVRRSITFKPPARGKYEIRLTRLTDDSSSTSIRDELFLSAIRTVTYQHPVNVDGMALVALRIRATDQLNGSLDEFNCIAEAYLPVWDGSGFSYQKTRNPAWAALDVLRGSANKAALLDSKIDLAAFKDWADACDQNSPQPDFGLPVGVTYEAREPYWQFDAVIDYQTSVWQLLSDIGSSCRTTIGVYDGLIRPIRDVPKTDLIQIISPTNSTGFSGNIVFADIPEAVKVRFVSEARNYQQDEITVYADGFDETTAEKIEAIEAFGVTRASQSWREGRYFLGVASLRREVFTVGMDFEHLVCTRGDLVGLNYDVASFGSGSSRIKGVTYDGGGNATEVLLQMPVNMEPATAYACRIRLSDGRNVYAPVNTGSGEVNSLTFTTPIDVADAPEAGDMLVFGVAGQEKVDCLVKEILPKGDEAADLILVPAAPAVHTADQSTIPAYDPQISRDPAIYPPEPVANLSVYEQVRTVNNSDPVVDLKLSWRQPSGVPAKSYDIYQLIDGDYRLIGTSPTKEYTFSSSQFLQGETVSFKVVGLGPNNQQIGLNRAVAATYSVQSNLILLPPNDVSNFQASVTGDTTLLNWDSVGNSDLSHYVLKYTPDTGGAATWGQAQVVLAKISPTSTSATVPSRVGTYLIKAVDNGGRESAAPALLVTTTPALTPLNVVEVIDESGGGFAGTKDCVIVSSGNLRLSPSDMIDDWPDFDAIADFDNGQGDICSEGTYEFASYYDLGAVFTSRLTVAMNAAGQDLTSTIDDWLDFDAVENFDGDADPASWDIILEVSKTNDDPSGSPTWGDWQTLKVGDYRARAFRFRARLYSYTPSVTPIISDMQVTIDMPDRVAAARDISSSASADTTVTFSPPFKQIPAIAVDVRGLMTGEYHQITAESTSGFTINVRNAGGMRVARNFDYVAKGYGA